MTDEEMNSYRLTSLEEPTDEMLSQIMKEAAEDARTQYQAALRRLMDDLWERVREQKEKEKAQAQENSKIHLKSRGSSELQAK